MSENEGHDGLVSGPPHEPGAPTVAEAVDAPAEQPGDTSCEHDWTVVNRDENRLIEKCERCGATRRQ